ncbi:hypothetical protein ACFVS2_20985 [Brevibacillus sp. NPDC058079]|uniref:hypothetical protein n=1 Tax=Brevibacillus sp. NPDC058079 TaxID=3346330 RepID=UPI0036E2DD55
MKKVILGVVMLTIFLNGCGSINEMSSNKKENKVPDTSIEKTETNNQAGSDRKPNGVALYNLGNGTVIQDLITGDLVISSPIAAGRTVAIPYMSRDSMKPIVLARLKEIGYKDPYEVEMKETN